MKLYKYTLLKQDGTKQVFEPRKKMDLHEIYATLDCSTVELIPKDYWIKRKYGRVTMWGDEEGRFKETNHRNPHFDILFDPMGNPWDVVGDILMEQVYHQ